MDQHTIKAILPNITVAIPTYNGAKRIPLVLECLKRQTQLENINWEIIVVDNNSQDNTAEVIKQYQTQWSTQVPLRYCFEPQQGAAFARQKAVKEARGALVGFLDDDNLPEENWLSEAISFSHKYPKAGAFSGRIYGQYETPPPDGFEKIKAFLAIRDHGCKPIKFQPERLNLPPAASLIVRRKAWLESSKQGPKLSGPSRLNGNAASFIGGEDYEALLYLHKAGWEIWYAPQLCTHHQIPATRLKKDYLLSLAKGCGLATYQLKCISSSPQKSKIVFIKILAGNLKRIILHWLKYRNRIDSELELSVAWEFYWGSFLSPFVNPSRDRSK